MFKYHNISILHDKKYLSSSIFKSYVLIFSVFASLTTYANTATTSGSLNGSASSNGYYTITPNIPSGTTTSFPSYGVLKWTYALVPFYVGSSGVYSATSTTSPVINTTWLISGLFTPNDAGAPTTPISAFIQGNFSNTNTASLTNLSLIAGQQYTFLIAFNTGAHTQTYLISMSGPGCISFGLTNNCQVQMTPVSEQHTFSPFSDQITSGVASTLDTLSASNALSGSMFAAISKLAILSDEQRAVGLKRLTSHANNGQLQGASVSMNAGLNSVAQRMNGIRNAGALAWAEPDWKNIQLASAGSMSGLLEPRELRLGTWGRVLGGQAKQNASNGYAGYKANTWGLSFGADQRLDSGTLIGAAFTYTKTDLSHQDYLAGSGGDIKNYQLTAYASHDLGNYYLEGQVSYGHQHYFSQRDTQISGVATADFNGNAWAVRLGSGIPLNVSDSITLTPIAALEYERFRQDGYTETGADVLSLAVNKSSIQRVRTSVGVQLAADQHWGSVKVRPSIHLKWLHDFKNGGLNTIASFVGGGSAFLTPGQKIARNSANIGASMLFSVKRNAALTISYDLDTSRGFRNQNAQLIGQIWF